MRSLFLVLLAFSWAARLASAPAAPEAALIDAARVGEHVVAVGLDGRVLRFDATATEQPVLPPAPGRALMAVAFADARQGWAAGHEGVVLQSRDGGLSWETVREARARQPSWLDVTATSERHVVLIGADGLYAESHDGGRTWRERTLDPAKRALNRLARSPDGDVWLIVGDGGLLLRSTDEGATWKEIPLGTEVPLYGLLFLNDGEVLAFGLGGVVFRSEDAGASWTYQPSGTRGVLLAGVQTRDGTIALFGQARLALLSRDGGRSFTLVRHDLPVIAEVLPGENGTVSTFGEAGLQVLPITTR